MNPRIRAHLRRQSRRHRIIRRQRWGVVTVTELFVFDVAAAAKRPRRETPAFEVIVRGIPGPQGSKRHVGNGRMIESSKKVKPWREAVVAAALERRDSGPALTGPLAVEMVFTLTRPAGHYRTGRNAHLLRPAAPVQPAAKPDLSKLARSTEDALTTAGVYRDDALIAEYRRLAKVFAGEDPDALDSPGAVIRIYTLGETR